MENRNRIIRHLEEDYSEPVRDPIWKHIYLSPELLKIVSLEPFQELNNIKQLGPAYLVYPGATHTRLSHSLGTFHIAKRILHGLMMHSPGLRLTLEGVKAFLAAALLHDLGHYPFAHSLKNLQVKDHEILTGEIILEGTFAKVIKKALGLEPLLIASIIDNSMDDGNDTTWFYRRLLSGVLDPDKLDYLNRDAYYCGVPYGIQDVDFFLSEILYHDENGIALTLKGLTSVETLLFSKYLMYKTVYWHKTVRIATAMIKKALLLGLREGIISRENLYHLTDRTFNEMLAKHLFSPFSLVEDVFRRRLYKQIAAIPFSSENNKHRELEDIHSCLEYEALLARQVGKNIGRKVPEHEIIIDIPEPLSFEIDLPIVGAGRGDAFAFGDVNRLFNREKVISLGQSLRQVSLICSRDQDLIRGLTDLYSEEDLLR